VEVSELPDSKWKTYTLVGWMNIYTQAMPDAMRRANSRVVEMVLPERKVG
jgi:hypothetical protein